MGLKESPLNKVFFGGALWLSGLLRRTMNPNLSPTRGNFPILLPLSPHAFPVSLYGPIQKKATKKPQNISKKITVFPYPIRDLRHAAGLIIDLIRLYVQYSLHEDMREIGVF